MLTPAAAAAATASFFLLICWLRGHFSFSLGHHWPSSRFNRGGGSVHTITVNYHGIRKERPGRGRKRKEKPTDTGTGWARQQQQQQQSQGDGLRLYRIDGACRRGDQRSARDGALAADDALCASSNSGVPASRGVLFSLVFSARCLPIRWRGRDERHCLVETQLDGFWSGGAE